MKSESIVLIGVGGLAVVGALIFAGQQSNNGAAFASADPQSVAAVENGIASQISEMNTLTLAKTQIAANTILGLAQAQQNLLLGQSANATTVQTASINANAATTQVGLQTGAQVQEAQIGANVATTQAQLNLQAQQAYDALQHDVSNNQTTQVQAAAGAQKTTSFWNTLGSVAKSIIPFSSAPAGAYPVTDPNGAFTAYGTQPPVYTPPASVYTP